MSTSSSVWDSPGARTSRPPWADYVDAAERAQQALHAHGFIPRAWLVIRWLLCAAVFGLAVSIPFGFNYDWNHTRGWYYVAFALVTSTLAPAMVSSLASRNIGRLARLFCATLMIGCLCYDWSNAARVHAAKQDTNHASAEFKKGESDNSKKDRESLEKEIASLDKAAEGLPVSKIEADLTIARATAGSAWTPYLVRKGRKTATLMARPQRFANKVTELEGKLKSANDREAKKAELKKFQNVEAPPSAADSGIKTAEKVLGWFGVRGLDDATLSRIVALWDTGLMQLLCLVAPHGMFLFLFGALAPDAAQRRRLQEARERAAERATREAKRTVKTEMWRRWRKSAQAKVKDAFMRKKAPAFVPELEPEPEPAPEPKPAAAEEETTVEPPLKVAPEASGRWQCDDSFVEAIANARLQRSTTERVDTKEFYNKAWVPWHHDRGTDPGKQRRMTDRLKASGIMLGTPFHLSNNP